MTTAPTLEVFNQRGIGKFPGYLGIEVLEVGHQTLTAQLPHHLAPNGYLHAGSVVTLADTAAGYACVANLPEGAQNFTTIELKSNHFSTAREGTIVAVATVAHMGRTTQVWDVKVTDKANGKTIALFRCTQMILYPKSA
jgi:1,4-dihydroxy-2-naphthoyl-CoA hydrolase